MAVWAHKSTALACENLMLSLRAYGYDSCPMEGMDSTRIKKLLGLSSPAEISMVISAGKRAENGVYGKQIRFESKYFIHEV
jgi:nitroreductase